METYIIPILVKMKDTKESGKTDIESASDKAVIACTSYLDSGGRLYLPQRIRDRAGLERGVGYYVDIQGSVLKGFPKETE